MARNVKHTVSINGQVIGTRKSPRVYTHAIIGHRNRERDLASAKRRAENDVRVNWSFYEQEANPETNKYGRIEYYAAIVAAGQEAYHAKQLAGYEAQVGDERDVVMQWSMSEHNARAKMNYWAGHGWFDVRVVPVDRAE